MNDHTKLFVCDWDDSLRRGFSALAWVAHLTQDGLFNPSAAAALRIDIECYKTGQLDYNGFVNRYADHYKNGIAGFSVRKIQISADRFAQLELTHLYSFTLPLLDLLAEQQFDVVVISGSPEVTVRTFFATKAIKAIYALQVDSIDGNYTPNLTSSYSGGRKAKGKIMDMYLSAGNYAIVGGIGDSESDLAFLNKTNGCLIVGDRIETADVHVPHLRVHEPTPFDEIKAFVLSIAKQVG